MGGGFGQMGGMQDFGDDMASFEKINLDTEFYMKFVC